MAPTTTSIFPPLSRAFKSQEYLPNNDENRKRKRHQRQRASFEVRPSTNGVGIFATKDISCGDLMIVHEDPIVHCCSSASISNNRPKPNTCNTCATPIGSLRENHLMAPQDLILPYLDGDDDQEGLVFTKTSDMTYCGNCKEVAWCSNECYQKGRLQHTILCSDSTSSLLKDFYRTQDNPIIFQLATQSVTLTLSHYLTSSLSKNEQKTPLQQFYWWKDYGSHPLWWEVGSSKDKKKKQAEEFGKVLRKVLIASSSSACHKRGVELEDHDHKALILQICTMENVGSILGMLQCNVMEYEYESPTRQYMEHVEEIIEQIVEEESHGDIPENNSTLEDEDNSEEENHVIALKAGCEWLVNNIRNKTAKASGSVTNNDKKDKRQSNSAIMTPPTIMGSGLYPLLTLANHDCNPNASIEFLQESNRGTMVATRDILVGEEICITYVPNGGVGGGDGSEYFGHFEPTRTWKWLNSIDIGDDERSTTASEQNMDENGDCDDGDGCLTSDDDGNVEEQAEEEEQLLLEGANQMERANALLEYGFQCQCRRCLDERRKRKY